ncbi:hypothetical protein L1987_61941 [Smallanthus sonchifolius]|uniref:Uncharacterized protein n=1 Tax=Smallanthus sonchifolius TaxID=185202 RepID=A0ACB9C944_9ASTR|nr:hypothetical protein L1987_61941 [Smallanthus sonchifolius]
MTGCDVTTLAIQKKRKLQTYRDFIQNQLTSSSSTPFSTNSPLPTSTSTSLSLLLFLRLRLRYSGHRNRT